MDDKSLDIAKLVKEYYIDLESTNVNIDDLVVEKYVEGESLVLIDKNSNTKYESFINSKENKIHTKTVSSSAVTDMYYDNGTLTGWKIVIQKGNNIATIKKNCHIADINDLESFSIRYSQLDNNDGVENERILFSKKVDRYYKDNSDESTVTKKSQYARSVNDIMSDNIKNSRSLYCDQHSSIYSFSHSFGEHKLQGVYYANEDNISFADILSLMYDDDSLALLKENPNSLMTFFSTNDVEKRKLNISKAESSFDVDYRLFDEFDELIGLTTINLPISFPLINISSELEFLEDALRNKFNDTFISDICDKMIYIKSMFTPPDVPSFIEKLEELDASLIDISSLVSKSSNEIMDELYNNYGNNSKAKFQKKVLANNTANV